MCGRLMLSMVLATVALGCSGTPAVALTAKQVREQADLLIEELMLDLVGYVEDGDDAPPSYSIKGRLSDCRVTTRTRGRCAVDVLEEQVGAECDAWGVVTQRGRNLVPRLVDIRCTG